MISTSSKTWLKIAKALGIPDDLKVTKCVLLMVPGQPVIMNLEVVVDKGATDFLATEFRTYELKEKTDE